MKKFLTLAILITAGSAAYANDKAHEECLKAIDYKGCIEARSAIKKTAHITKSNIYFTEPLPPKKWKGTIADTYLMRECLDVLPDELLYDEKTEICLYFNYNTDQSQTINTVDSLNDGLQKAINKWIERETLPEAAKYNAPLIYENASSCQPGKSLYQKRWLFGLIKGGTMCLTDFEAESLKAQRRQSLQNSINNMNNNKPTSCYGTANTIGSTTYAQANCY
jgi:hypothetical protein